MNTMDMVLTSKKLFPKLADPEKLATNWKINVFRCQVVTALRPSCLNSSMGSSIKL